MSIDVEHTCRVESVSNSNQALLPSQTITDDRGSGHVEREIKVAIIPPV
jgi:hypothetical protein